MSVLGLMRQTISFYARSSYTAQGREVVGSEVSSPCRFQGTSKNIVGQDGRMLTISGIVDIPPTTVANIDDKAIFETVSYRVHSRYPIIDGLGAVHHVKLELVKWQT